MTAPNLLARLRVWLRRRLGTHYASTIETIDRAATAFVVTLISSTILAEGFSVHAALSLGYWRIAALSAIAAAVSTIKSALMINFTGSPALLSPISKTLRSRRAQPIVQHHVPVRRPKVAAKVNS